MLHQRRVPDNIGKHDSGKMAFLGRHLDQCKFRYPVIAWQNGGHEVKINIFEL
jgi:hypothetical protein